MADENETVDVEETDTEQKEVFTKEQVAEMVKQSVEDATGRLNTEFQKKFAEIKKEKQEAVDSKKSYEEETRDMVAKMQREQVKSKLLAQGIKAYSAAGLPVPDDEVVLDLIREDSDDPLRALNWTINNVLEAKKAGGLEKADEIAKRTGRTVQDTKPNFWESMPYKEIQALPAEEFAKVPKEVLDKAIEAGLGKT